MKKLPILLACALLLTGCARTEPANSSTVSSADNPTVSSADSAASDSAAAPQSTAPQTAAESAPQTAEASYTQQDVISALNSYGGFVRDYLCGEKTAELTDTAKSITADDGAALYKVNAGTVADRRSLFAAMRAVMTDELTNGCFDSLNNRRFALSNDALYLASAAERAELPYNMLCLSHIEDAGGRLLLRLTAYGDNESFRDYAITLAKTADGLRVDEAAEDCTLALVQLSAQQAPAESPLKSERAQIRRLLRDYGEFYRDYLDAKKTCALTDAADVMTEDATQFYRIAQGEVTTEQEMLAAMRAVATDKQIEACLMPDFSQAYRASGGALYLAEWAGLDGSLLGTDEVWLDTVEEQDGVITLTLTAFGAADSWGFDADEYTSFTVKLARTPEGLRVDEAGASENGYLSSFTVTERPE